MTAPASLGKRLRDRWLDFWFAPASPESLGVCRLLFFGGVLYFYGRRDFSGLGGASEVFFKPILWFRILGLTQPSMEHLQIVQLVWRISLLASFVGLLTRIVTPVAFVLGTYLLGLQYCFGSMGHSRAILVFAMASLALSPAGDALSVDSWIRARKGVLPPRPGGEYRWPVRVVWVQMACVFFAAAVSKFRHAGLSWVTSDTLAFYLVQTNYPLARPANPPWNDWGLWLARHPFACRSLAAGSLAVESLFPLALFSRRLRPWLVSAAFMMQAGITVVMGPNFDVFMLTYVFWVPWDGVGRRLLRSSSRRSVAAAASAAGGG